MNDVGYESSSNISNRQEYHLILFCIRLSPSQSASRRSEARSGCETWIVDLSQFRVEA